MFKLLKKRFFLILFLMVIGNKAMQAQIVLTVSDIEEVEGNILYGLYDDVDPSTFLGLDTQLREVEELVTSTNQRIIIDSLPAGTYAISLFHDLNSDGVMEKNFIGIPKEPYGFSQNYKPMFRAPRFEDAQFYYDGDYLELEIKLIH